MRPSEPEHPAVALLYDVHGNLPALEAVIEALEEAGIEDVVVGGDVMPGPMPGACLDLLLARPGKTRFLYGNGERDTLRFRHGEPVDRVPDSVHPVMRWVADGLRTDQVEEIERWPASLLLEVPGVGRVLCCHATPRDDNEIFTRITPEERLRAIFAKVDADMVVCGHTHMQFDRCLGELRVVNVGSVGMPFGVPGAYWGVLSSEGVELRRTDYDLDQALARIRATDYPDRVGFRVLHPPDEEQMLAVFEAAAPR
ncbi:MAG: metallophosphatase family protein [Gemmatimonadota bacterium]|nr:metallophosphatase family protein [Gemmatimonadota bacterium]